jgi:hypothetical protein
MVSMTVSFPARTPAAHAPILEFDWVELMPSCVSQSKYLKPRQRNNP